MKTKSSLLLLNIILLVIYKIINNHVLIKKIKQIKLNNIKFISNIKINIYTCLTKKRKKEENKKKNISNCYIKMEKFYYLLLLKI